MDQHILTLCREYAEHVDALRSGLHSIDDMRILESERILLHDDLCIAFRVDRTVDMYRRARAYMLAARGSNLQ